MRTGPLLRLCAVGFSLTSASALAQSVPQFRTAVAYPAGVSPTDLRLADFNRDGALDIAVVASGLGGPDGALSILQGRGDGTFEEMKSYPAKWQPGGLVVGEVTGDAWPDVVMLDYSANIVSLFRGTPIGRFAGRVDQPGGAGPTDVELSDFDGDGALDLAVANFGSEAVGIHRGLGHGRFASPTEYAETKGPLAVAVSDLNMDGVPDVITGKAYSEPNYFGSAVSVRLGIGDGTLGPSTKYQVGRSVGDILVDDFNEDGKSDLAAVCAESRTVSVLLGDGTGGFGERADYTTGDLPFRGDVGDLNRDGHTDIVIGNHQENTLTIYVGRGDGTFRDRLDYPAGGGFFIDPVGVGIGDLDGNGWFDLAVANSNTGTVSVLLNAGETEQTASRIESGGASTSLLSLDDDEPDALIRCARSPDGSFLISGRISGGTPSSLAVFDVHGRLVRRIPLPANSVPRIRPARFEVEWDTRTEQGALAPSGVYLLRVEPQASAGGRGAAKLVVVR